MLKKVFSLRDYVSSLFAETEDPEEVATILIRRADHNADLHRDLILLGAKQAVRSHFSAGRRSVTDTVIKVAPRSEKEGRASLSISERIQRQAAKEKRRQFWDTYSLYGHKLLRDATAKDLRDSIMSRKAQVAGGLKAIRFEQAILEKLKLAPPGKTCSEFFAAKKIDDLRVKYYGE